MRQLRQLAIAMFLTLGVTSYIAAQSFDCPTVEHRHNGNGQSQMLTSYFYAGSASNLPSASEYEGQITLLFASYPPVVPFISAVLYNGIQTSTVVGPPSTVQQTSNGYRVKYDLYYTNLPANNANYSLKFNTPNAAGTGAGSFLKTCDYFGSGNLRTPTSTETVPVIASHPVSVINCGQNVTFSVSASATGTISYQWRANGENISGATSSSYTTNVAGSYDVVVSTIAGSVTSNAATLSIVIPATPTLAFAATASSQNTYDNTPNKLYLGYGAQYGTISVTNAGSNTYNWTGTNLSGADATSRTFTPTAGGNYTLSVTATNSYGCVSPAGNITICVLDVRAPGGSASNPKVYICHIPPGNVNNPQSLSVSVSAVPAHVGLHGGDKLGTCGQACGVNKTGAAINLIEDEIHMHIMPNPVISVPSVMIESTLGDVAQVQIIDIQGKVVYTGNVATNNTVSLNKTFESGLYFINATVEGVSVQSRMLVQ